MPREVFAIGAEARLIPSAQKTIEGAPTTIPAHWTIVSIFAGVDERRSELAMYSCLTGVDTRGSDLEGARRALQRALRLYPVDGMDIRVENSRVAARTDRNILNRLRNFTLWNPGADFVGAPGTEETVVGATCVGFGVGLEFDAQRNGHLCPYYAALVYEEQKDGTERPYVIPARHFPPLEPASRPDRGERLQELIPLMFTKLLDGCEVGGALRVRLAREPSPWYCLEAAYQDTTMGAAFADAEVKTGVLSPDRGA